MKSSSLYGGGDSNSSDKYHFNGVTFQARNEGSNIELVGRRGKKVVISITLRRTDKVFDVFMSEDSLLEVEHLYAIERLLQSYALTFGFSIIQIVLPIHGALRLKSRLEYSCDFEVFPPIG